MARFYEALNEKLKNFVAQPHIFCEPLLPAALGNRNIMVMDVGSVEISCGFAVPTFEFLEERTMLTEWTEDRGPDGLQSYWEEKNQQSIDDYPTKLLAD